MSAPLSTPKTSLVWVIANERVGDRQQLFSLAQAVGLPFETKWVYRNAAHEASTLEVRPSLAHVDVEKSSKLEAPWPDLIITVGRSCSLVALWVKAQTGNRCRIALLNIPKGRPSEFDLAIVPIYYRFRDGPNVCRIGLPLSTIDKEKIIDGMTALSSMVSDMKKPLHVLLLGGPVGSLALDGRFVEDTLRMMRSVSGGAGSVFVCGSPRTPTEATERAERLLGPHDRLFRWQEGQQNNPYHGLLGHGDVFTVTGETTSMLAEIARLGKKLVIAPLPSRFLRSAFGLRGVVDSFMNSAILRSVQNLVGQPKRDFNRLHRALVAGGHAVMLGETPEAPHQLPSDDTARAAAAVRALLD